MNIIDRIFTKEQEEKSIKYWTKLMEKYSDLPSESTMPLGLRRKPAGES